MNRSTSLDPNFERFVANFLTYSSHVSTGLSMLTFYLLWRKSAFFSTEIRVLHVSMFLNNFHFCILFEPFLYPALGGGFCIGILCSIGVKFHYNWCFWVLTIIMLNTSFISLLFAKHQTILHPLSRLRFQFKTRFALYSLEILSMAVVPILFCFAEAPIEFQHQVLDLDWIDKNKVYSMLGGSGVLLRFIVYSVLANLVVFGLIAAGLFLSFLYIISTINTSKMSKRHRGEHRAKIKNVTVVLIQMLSSFLFGVAPMSYYVSLVGVGIGKEIETRVLIAECLTGFVSPLNSIVFVVGNKPYIDFLRKKLSAFCHKFRPKLESVDRGSHS